MLTELGNTSGVNSGHFSKKQENKKTQSAKNSIAEMKNILEGMNSRLSDTLH